MTKNSTVTKPTRVYTSGATSVTTAASTLERIIVNKNGADCTMTIGNGNSALGVSETLSGDIPRVIECGFHCDDSIKITLAGNDPAEHWYKMDATTGSVCTDDGAGTAANLTATNMENGDWEDGKVGQALHFDGVDEYAVSAVALHGLSTAAFSVSAWVKFDDITTAGSGSHVIWAPWGDGGIHVNSGSGKVVIQIFKNINNRIECSYADHTWVNGSWYLVTLTYDGSNKAAGFTLYINGGKRPLTTDVDTLTTHNLDGVVRFGHSLDGYLDDIRIYDTEITEDAVDWIYNGGEGRSDDYSMADILVVWGDV